MLTFLKFFTIVGTAILGVVGSILNLQTTTGQLSKQGWMFVGGIVLMAILTFIADHYTNKESEAVAKNQLATIEGNRTRIDSLILLNSKLSESNSTLSEQVTEVYDLNSKQSDELLQLAKINNSLAKTVKEYNDHLLKTLSGHDSYCRAFIYATKDGDQWQVDVQQHGDYPLRDLKITITDIEENIDREDVIMHDLFVASLLPGKVDNVGRIPRYTSDRTKQTLVIFFSALNGQWRQTIQFTKDQSGHWSESTHFDINNINAETIPITENPFDYYIK